jgi:hypothetical protein
MRVSGHDLLHAVGGEFRPHAQAADAVAQRFGQRQVRSQPREIRLQRLGVALAGSDPAAVHAPQLELGAHVDPRGERAGRDTP